MASIPAWTNDLLHFSSTTTTRRHAYGHDIYTVYSCFSCLVQRGKNKMRKYSWQCFFFFVCLILIFPWGLLILFNNCAISIARHWPIALILPGQERAAYGQLWRAIHVVSRSLDRLSTEDEKCTDCYADFFFFFSTVFYFSFNKQDYHVNAERRNTLEHLSLKPLLLGNSTWWEKKIDSLRLIY